MTEPWPLNNACPRCLRSPGIACVGIDIDKGYAHPERWALVLKEEED